MSFSGQTMPSWYDIIGFGLEHAEDEGGIKDSVKTGIILKVRTIE